jgi:galactonate dehydratase
MTVQVRLNRIEFASVRVAERTEWTFAEVYDASGLLATTEITSGENTVEAVRLLPEFLNKLKSHSIGAEADVPGLLELAEADLRGSRPLATAISALRTAVIDLQAQQAGVSMTEVLGGESQQNVTLYANINRHLLTRERTPEAFARAAELAVKRGFTTVKCAPFDEVRPPSSPDRILEVARTGIERIAAIREAVGPDIRVLVDCHSRFETHTAHIVAVELAKHNIGWFEEPVSPTENSEGLAEVASKVTMPVAGGESGYGEGFFADLIERRAISVIMPDIKYCGGAGVACRAGRAAIKAGAQASLHSPSGPISLLSSAHATAAMNGAMPLEHAVYEADWRAALVTPNERIEGGKLWFPGGAGLGARLNDDVVMRYGRRWKP